MARCFSRNSNKLRCENEAIENELYCLQHEKYKQDTDKKVDHLISAFAELKESGATKKKDFWDKVSASSTLLSGLFVGLIGVLATATYNHRELASQNAEKAESIQVRRVEIVQKFFPHLVSLKESEQKGALLAIASLGDEALATDLASNFGGAASQDVLNRLASSADPLVAKQAIAALDATLIAGNLAGVTAQLKIVSSTDSGQDIVIESSAFIISKKGYLLTAAHVISDLENFKAVAYFPRSNQTFSAHLVSADQVRDVALFRIKSEFDYPNSLEIGTSFPRVGEDIFTLGLRTSGGITPTFTFNKGSISSLNGPDGAYTATINSGPGFSGAPVSNSVGQLVGYVVGGEFDIYGTPSATLIRPLSEVRDLLSIANM